jgi:membrane protein insertase Oxa1/YidC/SpoIIIJ
MMYSTPSGLTLYIMASTLGGIIDSYYVRKHIREEEAAGTLMENKPKEPPKPGSLQWRVQQWSQGIIARVNEAQQQQQQQRPKPGGTREDRPRRGR